MSRVILKDEKYYVAIIFLFTILGVFFCSKMSPLYPINEWSDINLYFNVGKAVFNGQTLYTESFDHKGPIIFLIYGIGYLLSHDSFAGMFVVQIITWFVIILSAYLTARLFIKQTYSVLVAVCFLPFLLSHSLEGGSAEEFVTAFIAVSLYLFIRYFIDPKQHRLSDMYIHGVMWGLVFFTKFNLVVFWIFPLIAIGLILLRQKEYKNLTLNVALFIAGAITVALPIIVYFIAKGALYEAYDIYVTLNAGSRVETLGAMLNNVAIRFYQRLRFETFEFLIINFGAFVFPLVYIKNWIARFGLALSFLSLFGIIFMATGYVYYYSIPYYIYAIPGLIVIAGLIERYIPMREGNKYICIIFIILGIVYCTYSKNFFAYSADVILRKEQAKEVAFKFAPTIRKEQNPTLLNLGLDNANAVFTYANVMPNVQYFLAPNFTYDVYPRLRDEQTRYIEEGKTQFVILTEYSINYEHFSQLQALQDNYKVVDTFEEYFSWRSANRTYYLYKRIDE